MNADNPRSDTDGNNSRAIRQANAPDHPPVDYAAGFVWPQDLGIGSLEDQLNSVQRIQAHRFDAFEAELGPFRVVAVTPSSRAATTSNLSTDDAIAGMAESLVATHRPDLVICATALHVDQAAEDSSQDVLPDWQQRNAISVAGVLRRADGSTFDWPHTDAMRDLLRRRKLPIVTWHQADAQGSTAPWTAAEKTRVIADESASIVQAACAKREIACMCLGIVRWLPGEGPSRELTDYRASDSPARKLGRILRWAVKNRAAIKETARAAEQDLVTADKLATEVCALAQDFCQDESG